MAWSCLVPLQASGSRPPLFFAHPGGGDVVCFLDLARCLGSDRPVYGLQSPGLYGDRDPYTTIEEMAAHYLEALKTVQPEGPYFLGGWSLGGLIAYEIAQQLIAQGQQVGQLLLLDTAACNSGEEHIELEEDPALLLLGLFSEALPISRDDLHTFHGEERINYVLKQAVELNLLPPDIEIAQVRSFLETYKTNMRAGLKYVLRPYPGAATLFKTSRLLSDPPSGRPSGGRLAETVKDPTRGWGRLAAGGVRIVDVPGSHATMVRRPHVETLALRINDCLNEA